MQNKLHKHIPLPRKQDSTPHTSAGISTYCLSSGCGGTAMICVLRSLFGACSFSWFWPISNDEGAVLRIKMSIRVAEQHLWGKKVKNCFEMEFWFDLIIQYELLIRVLILRQNQEKWEMINYAKFASQRIRNQTPGEHTAIENSAANSENSQALYFLEIRHLK